MQAEGNTIYWANALFTEADRRFNADCAVILREAGYRVFLPQEADVNDEASPTAEAIFRTDTSALLNSTILLACLDQETIDSGVACEIGLAYAFGIPIIGLYTDIRQYRHSNGKMYKNVFVVGAIEAVGEVVRSVKELLQVLPGYLSRPGQGVDEQRLSELVTQHYSRVGSKYADFIRRLEGWYQPKWNSRTIVEKRIQLYRNPKRILEIGCGTGELGHNLCRKFPDLSYVGFDQSHQMIAIAKEQYEEDRCTYILNHSEMPTPASFDLVLALFTLNDHPDKDGTLKWLVRWLRPEGELLIVDLSTQDLPRLTQVLRTRLATPAIVPDPRIDPVWMSSVASKVGLVLAECQMILPSVNFPSLKDLDQYLDIFGIYAGMDLPLGLPYGENTGLREAIRRVLETLEFPFTDRRAFVTCVLKRANSSAAN